MKRKVFGLRMESDRDVAEAWKQELGLEWDRIALYVVDQHLVRYAERYNAVVDDFLDQKYGEGCAVRVQQQAVAAYARSTRRKVSEQARRANLGDAHRQIGKRATVSRSPSRRLTGDDWAEKMKSVASAIVAVLLTLLSTSCASKPQEVAFAISPIWIAMLFGEEGEAAQLVDGDTQRLLIASAVFHRYPQVRIRIVGRTQRFCRGALRSGSGRARLRVES